MLWKKLVGGVVFICGVFLFLLSNYISEQVLIGQKKIDKAQGQVNTGKKLFSLSPYTKGVGDGNGICAKENQCRQVSSR